MYIHTKIAKCNNSKHSSMKLSLSIFYDSKYMLWEIMKIVVVVFIAVEVEGKCKLQYFF